jgi:hypothetical protein
MVGVSRRVRLRPQRTRRSGPVKITKADGTVTYEEPLSPAQMSKLAAAEERKDTAAAEEIIKRPRRPAPRTKIGKRLEAAARGRG